MHVWSDSVWSDSAMRQAFPSAAVFLIASSLIACETGRRDWDQSRLMATPEPPAPAASAASPESPESAVPPRGSELEEPKRTEQIVDRGSGILVGHSPRRTRTSITADGEEVTLNVVDADIREVVRLIFEETLGTNYVIDPDVQGQITARTSKPIALEDLVPMLDAILRMNGAALVQTGNFYRVVPIDQALSSGLSPDVRPVPSADRQGFGIRVVPLRFISAEQIVNVLEPFVPPSASIQVDPSRNLLLVAGSQDELATITDLASIFDVDWLRGMSFGLFTLDSASPEPLVAELQQIFGLTEDGPLTGIVRFLPIERLNAVLVISAQPVYIDRAKTWIDRLDQGADGQGQRVYVYPVQNSRAADLAEVLRQLFDLDSSVVGEVDLLAPGLEPISLGSPRASVDEDATVTDLGQSPQSTTQPLSPRGMQRRQASGFGPGASTAVGGNVRIIADATTNSLVIRATPSGYRKVETALRQLDVLPLQVLIEATIAEVTLKDELRYGVEWFFRFGSNEAILNTLETGEVAPTFPGFSALFSGPDDVRVVINALESVSDVNVISSPQILVLDNKTALLQVGNEVPIVTRQSQSVGDPEAPILNDIEQRQTGIILSVTPRVNASGLVVLEIEQEVSDVVQFVSGGIPSPTISERRIASTVAVQSGETVALGGLIQDDVETDSRGIPLLSRIPVLGWLFGSTVNTAARTELLVMITPRVVRDSEQARTITDELRHRLRGVAPLRSKVR